jgi:hypothetical protein
MRMRSFVTRRQIRSGRLTNQKVTLTPHGEELPGFDILPLKEIQLRPQSTVAVTAEKHRWDGGAQSARSSQQHVDGT